jgi:hypothetical protein
MIKFMGHTETGRPMFGMVLTEGNFTRLRKGLGIHINAEEMGLSEFKFKELTIFYEETEEIAAEKFTKHVGPETKIILEFDKRKM